MQPIRDKDTIAAFKDKLFERELRDWMIFIFGINTALRISDLLYLRVRDVAGKHILLRERKTKKERRILINAELRQHLDYYLQEYDWLESDDYLFSSYNRGKQPITTRWIYKVFKTVGSELGLAQIGTHSMRKSFGYHFYHQTKDIARLQTILNHATQRTTMIYVGLEDDAIDEAIANFKL